VRVALSDTNSENKGFLRPNAHLAIVLLSDEDDCSAEPDSTIFDEQVPGQGPSVRCALLGHTCGGQPVPAAPFTAPLAACAPYERGSGERQTRLIDVSELVEYVKKLKPGHPDLITVSSIMGWDGSPDARYALRNFSSNDLGGPRLQLESGPVCEGGNGFAAAGVRLKAFADAFGEGGSWSSICQTDLRPAMTRLGQQIAARMR
jgi:hypothetical protein